MLSGWGKAPKGSKDMVLRGTVVALDSADGETICRLPRTTHSEADLAAAREDVEKVKKALAEISPAP